MILTGPEIRKQIALGVECDGKERRVDLPSPREGNMVYDVYCFKDIVDCRMNYIDIDPYDESLVGPNSIDLRMGNELLVYEEGADLHGSYTYQFNRFESTPEDFLRTHYYSYSPTREHAYPVISSHRPVGSVLDLKAENATQTLEIPEDGLVLWPGILYLGRTIETIGSNAFVPIVEGRSSVGRLGVHVHVTAGFCDLGFRGTITLEIHVLHPIRVYPSLPICQAYFLEPRGEIELYKGRYQDQVKPTASRFGMKLENNDE